MNINFDALKNLKNNDDVKMVAILGRPGSGKTTTLLKLLSKKSAFISSNQDFSDDQKINGIFIENPSDLKIKDTIVQCINDVDIKIIAIDSGILDRSNKNFERYISLLQHSGKKVIVSMQTNRNAFNAADIDVKIDEISEFFDLKVYVENANGELSYKILKNRL